MKYPEIEDVRFELERPWEHSFWSVLGTGLVVALIIAASVFILVLWIRAIILAVGLLWFVWGLIGFAVMIPVFYALGAWIIKRGIV